MHNNPTKISQKLSLFNQEGKTVHLRLVKARFESVSMKSIRLCLEKRSCMGLGIFS